MSYLLRYHPLKFHPWLRRIKSDLEGQKAMNLTESADNLSSSSRAKFYANAKLLNISRFKSNIYILNIQFCNLDLRQNF